MDPNQIKLDNLTKNFEYEKISREVDSIENIEQLRNVTKSYIKLYFKLQETISEMKF